MENVFTFKCVVKLECAASGRLIKFCQTGASDLLRTNRFKLGNAKIKRD